MKLLAYTGGFHPEMPLEELRALGFAPEKCEGRLIIGSAENPEVLERLGYTHLVLEYLGSFRPGEDLPFDPREHVKGEFAARFKKLDFEGGFESLKNSILKELDPYIDKANLTDPEVAIYFFLTEDKIYSGKLMYEFSGAEFYRRGSEAKPFSQPITVDPRSARCWINLSQTEEGGKVLDPFCGTGTVLVEAGLMGLKVYGSDIDSRMVSGTRINMDYFGVEGEIRKADIQKLSGTWDEKFDAVVTDPPYGRSSMVGGSEIEGIYRSSMQQFEKVLKRGCRCVLGAPREIKFEEILKSSGTDFAVEKKFKGKVHGSLWREVYVLRLG